MKNKHISILSGTIGLLIGVIIVLIVVMGNRDVKNDSNPATQGTTSNPTGSQNQATSTVPGAGSTTRDTRAPAITDVRVSATTTTTATIKWTTDELADSQIEYGKRTSYGNTTTVATAKVTAHEIKITGLEEETRYHFRVISKDAAGNSAKSPDFEFTTKPVPDETAPTISDIESTSITHEKATIEWQTSEPADAEVMYGLSTKYGSTTSSSSLKKDQKITLTNLKANTTYHYKVKSKDAAGNAKISSDHTFTTTAAPDTTDPQISGVSVTSITSSSATIRWTTDELADSEVLYGVSTSYGNTTSSVTKVTSHTIVLNSLAADTEYHFKVKSKDAAGNDSTSNDSLFKTLPGADTTAPVVQNSTCTASTNSITCTWTTGEPSDSVIRYGLSETYTGGVEDGTMVKTHSLTISDLIPGTLYHLKIYSKDAAGNTGDSGDKQVTTTEENPEP
jgi:chitodextrinase